MRLFPKIILCASSALLAGGGLWDAYADTDDISRLHELSAYILASSGSALDINSDGNVNTADLCILKRQTLYKSEALRTVNVSTAQELYDALKGARAGDEILLAPGKYEWTQGGSKGSLYRAEAEGTAELPIILRSAQPDNPAVLTGTDTAVGYVLYVTGDFWRIENLCVTGSQKGIVLDNSNYSEINNCKVYNVGDEGIHLRDGSSHCKVYNCTVTDTGKFKSGYGEAIYVGSSESTTGYAYNCDYNLISHCTLGGGVTAELVDVKEYTTGTIIEDCVMYGGAISGDVSANAFMKVKGNECIVRRNTCFDEGNTIIRNAFEVHVIVEGWGYDNRFESNTVNLTNDSAYVLRVYSGSATGEDCTRIPSGLMYYND